MTQLDTDIALWIALASLGSALLVLSGVAEWAWIEVRAAFGWVSYLIRPYDMLADRRRWFWQPRQPCGHSLWIRRSHDGR